MIVNIDGIRSALTDDLNKLGELLKDAMKNGECVDENILDAFDEAAQNANFLNCIYDSENDLFNDLSNKSVVYLRQE